MSDDWFDSAVDAATAVANPNMVMTEAQIDKLCERWSTADARQLSNGTRNVVVPARMYAKWVAWFESGWKPGLHVVDSDDDSYGLFMINMKGNLGPDRRRRSNLTKNSDLLIPATNARVAHEIYSERGWSAWAQTTRDRADAKVLELTNGAGVDPTAAGPITGNAREAGLYPGQLAVEGAIGNGLGGLVNLVRRLVLAILNASFWKRAGIVVAGVLLLVVALALVVGSKSPAGQLAKLATSSK